MLIGGDRPIHSWRLVGRRCRGVCCVDGADDVGAFPAESMSPIDRDIYAAALQWLRRYGDTAWFEASLKCDEQIAKGDLEGERTWRRILAALDVVSDKPPSRTQH